MGSEGRGRPPTPSRPPGSGPGRALFPAAVGWTLTLGAVAAAHAVAGPGAGAVPGGGVGNEHGVGGDHGTGEGVSRPQEVVPVEREIFAMGTRLRGRAWAESRQEGVRALEAAFRAVEAEEDLLSTWRDDTELARVNRARPGRAVRVSPRLSRLLSRTRRLSRETGRAFDPTVGALVDAWDLRGQGRRPGGRELEEARASTGPACFRLSARAGQAPGGGGSVLRTCPRAWIDAGGFGKGSALDRARRELRDRGAEAALLDFGGQVVAVGGPPGREGFAVAVAHPVRRREPVALLRLQGVSAATTSASERSVVVDGERRGHVLDPRSGLPAPAGGSVTVVAGDPLEADALSTALFVMGPEEGMAWAAGRTGIGVLYLILSGGPWDPRGAPAAGATPADAGSVVACWNDAMEPHLDELPGELRREEACPAAGAS